MELTAEHLDGDDEPRRLNWAKILIGGMPLCALLVYLVIDGDTLLSDPEPLPPAEYFPPVAVVFASSGAEDRAVQMTARVSAERVTALRADTDSVVEALPVRTGERVAAGQQVCRLRPEGGAEATILFSPINGIVGSVHGAKGSSLARGEPCATVRDPNGLVAMADFPPRYADIITPGNRVVLTVGEASYESSVRVIYPSPDQKGLENRPFEVTIPEGMPVEPGAEVSISIETDQIVPMLVPFRTIFLDPELGMAIRIVRGDGPTGIIETRPITLVATAKDGFYVEGLPANARLVIQNSGYAQPAEGERVRIGQVG